MDIAAWLTGLGLERYGQTFADNDVDEALLRQLTEADLKDIGVGSLGHRKRLPEAVVRLETGRGRAQPSSTVSLPITAKQTDAERRQLTVMFVDLVGSTALSKTLDPEDMREVIRGYQNAVAGEITRLDGHVAKFMGDGVLAYFGWPRAHEDEAERAIRAGLAIGHAIARLELPGAGKLQTRIGIATGLVVVGDLVGEGAAQEQAVVGDTPNLAARLQAVADPGAVVIADATRRLVGDLFVVRDLGPQNLKGIGEHVPTYAVEGERALESRFAARQGGGVTPIVGRDQELGLLLERWRDARTGEGQVVLLTGEAGIGKSRITEALIEAVSNEPHFLLRYQCSPYHVDSALYPAIQHLSHGAGFVYDDSNEQRLDKLEDLLRRSSDDIGSAAPLVASLLGLNGEARYAVADLTPQQRRNRTLAALGDQLSGLVGRKPVLWVIEDVHWIDPTTLEFIEMALDRVQNARVLILITARPTFVASFASHPVVTRLALNRLAKAATQSMVQRITGGKRLPEVLLDEIAARTDGVPLFVEEMTKAVIESGLLRETPDAYHLDGPLSTLAIPTTLHDSLMARLDRLHPVKEVAQTAAVIGRSFDHNMIAALSALPEAQLTTAMQRLVEAELVFRRGTPPDATYLFKHALVRDAAYESLLKTKRTAMHARLLEILENAGGTAPEVKAQHAEAAGLAERALGYWERAGSETLKRPAYKEAIASFENAIRLCSTLGGAEQWKRREQNLQLQLGQALMAYRGYQAPETLRAFNSAMLLADEIGDVSLQIPAAFGQWASGFILGIGSVELAERFAELAESQSDTGPRLVAYRALGLERFNGGRFKESRALMQTALAGYDPVAHHDIRYRFGHDPRIQASNYLAWNLWHLGFPDQAASLNEESLRCTMEIDHLNTKCISLCYGIIMTSIWLRRPDEVLKFATEALHISEAMSLPLYHAWAQIQLGWAMSQIYDSQGLDLVEMGIREARQIGAGRLEPLHLGLAAEAYAHAGRTLEAKAKISEALDALEKYRDFAFAADLYRIRAGLELRANKSGRVAAEADLRRALAIAGQQESPSLQLRAARDLAASLAEQGKRRQALDLLAPIYGWFTEGFETLDLKEAKTLLEQL